MQSAKLVDTGRRGLASLLIGLSQSWKPTLVQTALRDMGGEATGVVMNAIREHARLDEDLARGTLFKTLIRKLHSWDRGNGTLRSLQGMSDALANASLDALRAGVEVYPEAREDGRL